MSQAGNYDEGGGPPFTDVETITGNSGGPVGPTPGGNIDFVFSLNTSTSVSNNTAGATIVGTPASNRLDAYLTNRIQGAVTTSDDTPTPIYTFDLGATPGVYLFRTRVIAFNQTTSEVASYASYRTVKTDGTSGTLLGASTAFIQEEGTMTGASVINSVIGNDASIEVEGLSTDVISWYALTEYVFVS